MKILMLGWELPPYYSGGLGIVCYQLSRYLANKGADIEFIVPFEADYSYIDFMTVTAASSFKHETIAHILGSYDSYKFDDKFDVESEVVPENLSINDLQTIYARNVARLASVHEFDIIHAHDWLTFAAGILAKQKTGKPLIVHVHSTEYDRAGGHEGNQTVHDIEFHGLMMADQIIAVSEATKRTIVDFYRIDPAKIQVVHNRIDIDHQHVTETANVYTYLKYMRERDYKVVLSAGRITIQKGLTHLLRAFEKVVSRRPKTLLLIVGSGDQYNELIELAAELGISENVIFAGYQLGTGKSWRDGFKVADLFVMPSASEPFGLTPLESIAYGAPALISKQSGICEVLTNVLKVDFWDEDAMANQILAVVENEGLHASLHTNSYAEFLGLSWHDSADEVMKLYRLNGSREIMS